MDRLDKVILIVKSLYDKKNPIIDWNEWVFEGHNKVVANWVGEISQKYEFDTESLLLAAYLHDIAYAWTSKWDPNLDELSEQKAKEILLEAGYSEEKAQFIVKDIIHGHGMLKGEEPKYIESKVLATADALAHFTTDFYLVMAWKHYLFEDKSLKEYKEFVLKKIDRDLNDKIFFEDFRDIAKPYYESLKGTFSL